MEKITRQEAIARGLNRYFTGEACKNNHIAERYTQSSVCIECLHPGSVRSNNPERLEIERQRLEIQREKISLKKLELEQKQERRSEIQSRSDAVSRMIKIKVTANVKDIEQIYDMAFALARLRCSLLRRRDVVLANFVKNFQWPIRCFAADADALREYAQSLFSANKAPSPPLIQDPQESGDEWPKGDPR